MSDTISHEVIASNGAVLKLELHAETAFLKATFASVRGPERVAEFSNIGDINPLDFIVNSDWSYFRDHLFGHGGQTPDFMGTIASLYQITESPEESDLSEEAAFGLRKSLNHSMTLYNGNDDISCRCLIPSLQNAGFNDDPHHMIKFRDSDDVMNFKINVWAPIQEEVQRELSLGLPSVFDPETSNDFEMM